MMKHTTPRMKRQIFYTIVLLVAILLMIVATPRLVQAVTDCSIVTEIPQVECEALIALYNSTNGSNWSDSSTNNWNVTNTPCDWSGIICAGSAPGNVTRINRAKNNLVGTMPTELGNMSNLTYLILNENQLTGPIPIELGNLSNLTGLFLYDNQLTGTIPTELSNLSNLTDLYLYGNQLTGNIPIELGNLSNLTGLFLYDNQLTGSIPIELGNLSNLTDLYLYKNQLTGTIQTELGNLSNLTDLYLYENQLTGTIPTELGNLSNLTDLYLYENQLTGTIPKEFGNLSNLTDLYLGENQLTGTIPSELWNLSKLSEIWLDCNRLTVPSEQTLVNFIDARPPSPNVPQNDWKNTQNGSCSVPSSPTALTANAVSSTQINLSWTDNSSNEIGFKVERPAGTLIYTTAADVISYSNTALSCGTTYSYSVKATNASGDSTAISASATTTACSTPSTAVPYLPPPTGGNISSSYNMMGGTFSEESNIKEYVSISNVVFEADVENHGLISNATIASGVTLNGGKLTSTIINKGTINGIHFVGVKLSGGTLGGFIVNNSKIGGLIKDVKLAGGATLKGGKVGGEISGEPKNPALITAAKILPGTVLSHVRISPTVQLPKNIVLGEGVILPNEPATLTDFGLEAEKIVILDAETFGNLEPAVFATFTAEYMAQIPPNAFVALKPAQIAAIQKESLAGLTTAQFKKIPGKTLSGLTADNIGSLPTAVINQLMPKHLDALNARAFKAMPSEAISKLFTHLDAKKITPKDVARLVPEAWTLDLETGALTPPVGAKLTCQRVASAQLPANVVLPSIPNLNVGFGVGGAGTPLIEGIKRSLATEKNLADFVLSQDENGILLVEGTGDSEGILYAFIPEADNAIKVDTNKIPIGFSVSTGGFYTITTPEGLQFKMIPVPKEPVALSQSLGGGEVVIGKRCDVLLELETNTRRRGRGARQVVIIDPFVEPTPDQLLCREIIPGVVICDEEVISFSKRSLREKSGKTYKVVYPDNTAQTVKATLLSPDTFIESIQKFADQQIAKGIEPFIFNMDGTFTATNANGQNYVVEPHFGMEIIELADEKGKLPRIEINGDVLTYTFILNEQGQADTQGIPRKEEQGADVGRQTATFTRDAVD